MKKLNDLRDELSSLPKGKPKKPIKETPALPGYGVPLEGGLILIFTMFDFHTMTMTGKIFNSREEVESWARKVSEPKIKVK